MNQDIIAGNWEQLKGKIRQTWGKLTDDDLAVIHGKGEELVGKLQERYGYSKERAKTEFDRFVNKECRTTTSDGDDFEREMN